MYAGVLYRLSQLAQVDIAKAQEYCTYPCLLISSINKSPNKLQSLLDPYPQKPRDCFKLFPFQQGVQIFILTSPHSVLAHMVEAFPPMQNREERIPHSWTVRTAYCTRVGSYSFPRAVRDILKEVKLHRDRRAPQPLRRIPPSISPKNLIVVVTGDG